MSSRSALLRAFAAAWAAWMAFAAQAPAAGDAAGCRVVAAKVAKYDAATLDPLLERAIRHAPLAHRKACDAFGLPCDSAVRPLVRLRDAAPLEPGRFPGPAARTFAEPADGAMAIVVELHTEYLVNGSGTVEERLDHEMVHAAMRMALGDERYGRIPRWLREGLALHVAGQGPARVRYEFSLALDTVTLLDGLDDRHEVQDYAEDALAVDFLLRRAGSGGLFRLMNLLLAGEKAHRAVERVAGVEPGRFETEFHRDVKPALDESAREELSRFLPAYRLFQQGEYDDARKAFEARIAPGPGGGLLAGALEGKAVYYHAKSLFQLGAVAEAAKGFRRVQREFGASCGLADDAAFFEAECLLRQGDVTRARAAFRLLARDFPYSNFSAPGHHKRGLCAYLEGDFLEAKTLFLATLEAFPKSAVAENALYDAANAARALAQDEEAARLFEAFLEKYPRSRFRALAEDRLAELRH